MFTLEVRKPLTERTDKSCS